MIERRPLPERRDQITSTAIFMSHFNRAPVLKAAMAGNRVEAPKKMTTCFFIRTLGKTRHSICRMVS